MDINMTDASPPKNNVPNIGEKNDSESEISSSFAASNLMCTTSQMLTSEMLSESMSCLNDDFRHDSFPHSPDSAELSTISLPNSEPHDTILNDPLPPRPSSEGDQPSSTSSRSFKCSKCPYETDRKNNLKRHMTTMHDPAPSTLDCCGTRFATKGDLRDHTKAAHGAGYTCWQCGHTFCRRALLQRHQSVHSGHKAFSCSKCGYQSSHKSNMQRHMQVHLHSKPASSPSFKDRLKNNGKSTFRSPSWKHSNALSRQNNIPVEKISTTHNLRGLLERESGLTVFVPPESKISTTNIKQALFVNRNALYPRLDHGQFSKALSDMAAANLSATLKNQESEKLCRATHPVSQSLTNAANSFSPGIWKLAFGYQNKPIEMNYPGLKNISATHSDSNRTLHVAESGVHQGGSKLTLSEFGLRMPHRPEQKISALANARPQAFNNESKRLSNEVFHNIEECGSHSHSGDTPSLQRSIGRQSAFVKVPPSDRRIHRPIPRYGNSVSDFSLGKFTPSIESAQHFTSGKGPGVTAQLVDVFKENNCQLERAMWHTLPTAPGEKRISPAPNHLPPSQNLARSNTIFVSHAGEDLISHQNRSPIFKDESVPLTLTARISQKNQMIANINAGQHPVQDSASPLEPIDYSMQKKPFYPNTPEEKQAQTKNADMPSTSVFNDAEVSLCSARIREMNSTASPDTECNLTSDVVSDDSFMSSLTNSKPNELETLEESCRTCLMDLEPTSRNDVHVSVVESSGKTPTEHAESVCTQEYIPKKLRASRRRDM